MDFTFWERICRDEGEIRLYRKGECFAQAGDRIREIG